MPRGRQRGSRGEVSGPGRIYDLFYRKKERSEEAEEEKPNFDNFIEMCRKAHKKNPYKGKVSKDLKDAVDFLGWDIPPEAVVSAAKQYALMAAAAGVALSIALIFVLGYLSFPLDEEVLYGFIDFLTSDPLLWFILLMPLMLYGGVYYSIISYPPSVARTIFQGDLLPSLRVVGNIVLSMKLVPNLEKAMGFAVEHGRGFLADALQQVLWDTQLGIYATVEEGLDRVAYRVGRYSDEFKHAIMRIRTSLLEADDAKRYILLDSALNEAVEGVKNRMVAAASSLYSPSVQLFYLGVFLPLLLFIVLPVWGAFSPENPLASPISMVVLYNILLPIATYYFAKSILSRRPKAYNAPEVPDRLVKNYDRIKRNALLGAVGIFILGTGTAYYLHTLLDATPENVLVSMGICPPDDADSCLASLTEDQLNYYLQGVDTTPYALIFGIMVSSVLALAYYFYRITDEKLKIQRDIMEIEKEFKDAVYVLASRMGEGKPLENALDAVAENMPESKIASVFDRISYNVKNLGLTIEEAAFSPVFGVLKDLPSPVLHDAMRLVVSAVSLGTELASKALVSLSEQLRNEEQVVQRIRDKTGEIAAMMFTMAYFVGPIVLGITVALEKVIVSSVADINVSEDQAQLMKEMGLTVMGMENAQTSSAPPVPDWVFLMSVAVYTLEITAILVWFATYLHDGPNRIAMYRKLAYALVIATLLFVASAWASTSLVRGMM